MPLDLPCLFIFILFFCLFAFSRAAPAAYGSSQARRLIGAVATGLHQSHSHMGSKPCLQPTPMLDPQPTEQGQGSNPQTTWFLVGFVNHWATMGTPYHALLNGCTIIYFMDAPQFYHPPISDHLNCFLITNNMHGKYIYVWIFSYHEFIDVDIDVDFQVRFLLLRLSLKKIMTVYILTKSIWEFLFSQQFLPILWKEKNW